MRLRHQWSAGRLARQDDRRRVQTLHGAREDRPDQEQAGIRRQIGRVEPRNYHDRGCNRGISLRHVAKPFPAAQTGLQHCDWLKIWSVD